MVIPFKNPKVIRRHLGSFNRQIERTWSERIGFVFSGIFRILESFANFSIVIVKILR